jgi:antirestriction protein
MIPVTGAGLVSLIKDRWSDKSSMVLAAGYVRSDGKKPGYTAFYEALLKAKEDLGLISSSCQAVQELPLYGFSVVSNGKTQWISLDNCFDVTDIESKLGDYADYSIGEWTDGIPEFLQKDGPDFEQILEYLDNFERLGNNDDSAYAALCQEDDTVYSRQDFRDKYMGTYSDLAEYAKESHYEDFGDNLGYLENYIDWKKYAECELRHEYDTVDAGNGRVYVFSSG